MEGNKLDIYGEKLKIDITTFEMGQFLHGC